MQPNEECAPISRPARQGWERDGEKPRSAPASGQGTCRTGRRQVIESSQTAWASATFSGARHRYVLGLPAGSPADALADVAEVEFDLPGHIVADIILSERQEHSGIQRVAIEALTVEDA